ncbi:MAG: MotA/TolQ/ExbB proton channel family protein [Steroidobacteraceae bacterium]|nr:MotA/TolQ/ExbB proton channel family protein [Steroidobacteraceae bacterium]
MAVMQNLADPSKLGAGIAAAFTATVYGIGLANLLFLPAAAKLKAIVARQSQTREMVIEGMISIALGENPRSIESKLQGYLHDRGEPPWHAASRPRNTPTTRRGRSPTAT